MTSEEQQRWQKISDLVESMEPHLTAEEYFALFMQDEEVQKMCQEAAEAGKALKEMISRALADALNGDGDDHSNWGRNIDEEGNDLGEIPDGTRQLIDGEIREALREAVRRADSSNQWGSIPSHMQAKLRALVSREVDWRAVLRQFIGMSRRSNSRNSRKRVNRKVPYTFPGRARNYTANIAVYVDQSGSVDDRSLELLYGELRSLAKRTTFHFFPFDTSVDESNAFIWKKGQSLPDLKRTRCGGTDFQACVDHAHDNKGLFDGYLILSDGECGKPTPSRIRRGYIIVPGRKLYFEPDRGDVVIQMTGKDSD
jgi:predicted metal-dependent peptidase